MSQRFIVDGNDALTDLTDDVNEMLATIEGAQAQLRQSEAEYRYLFDEALTANFIAAPDGKILLCNRTFAEMFGYPSVNDVLLSHLAHLFPDKQTYPWLLESIKKEKKLEHFEVEMVTLDQRRINVIKIMVGLFAEGQLQQIIGYIHDVTERKRTEGRLRYLGIHDILTGLYNRSYFEQEMDIIDKEGFAPVGIIVCDVDGLKFVNDTLGHNQGDHLLMEAGKILRKSFGTSSILSRIGGDEFAVLLPNTDEATAALITQQIRKKIAAYNEQNRELPLSLSIGYAVRTVPSISMSDVFKEADNNMYREKIHHRQSVRSELVQTLTKALEARDYLTQGHAERLEHFVTSLAKAANLPVKSIADLQLLAEFHDIGKVGIPDYILNKPGPLTEQEKTVMQRHCEIGYRIACASQDLLPIADWILKHHEWWNGSGYPLGLKGDEIPLECRVLAIADAFDAMTNDRPYRKGMTVETACAELAKNAGTQFDPYLIKHFLEIIPNISAHPPKPPL
ncbi:diguanylate cyclase [Heliobacterium chlorum]|uniref:Diguanylate cyclase n=1 Tax=Heliobacterium chlorum TaxID=2698 RepID=A0ABR7SYZ6_HELCL|nr:HD domain-containing phosphohydrolase [Heliobacterium chlorum]MBC9783752.1 diguanylate cyclase [Heliobacterium chlorum]